MGLKRVDLQIVTQPAFIFALALLVANDFYFKAQYPDWLTGKLSDFAGLYVFAQLGAALSGMRIARVAAATAILFAAWKSPLATPLIEFFNAHSPVRMFRTIDYTDLAALAVLPLAVRLYGVRIRWPWSFLKYPLTAAALLAVMATSSIPPSYKVRFDLQERAPVGAAVYAQVDKFFTERGARCLACAESAAYREYLDARGRVTAKLNYDAVDRRLFVLLLAGVEERTSVDELQAQLMEVLHPRFENVTVIKELPARPTSRDASRGLRIRASPRGFPLSCDGNGIRNPAIARAMAIVDESSRLLSTLDLRHQSCGPVTTDAERCSPPMCRHVALGQVSGPELPDRAMHLRTRGYVGWEGTTLYIELSSHPGAQRQAEEFMDRLEKSLRLFLDTDVSIAVLASGER